MSLLVCLATLMKTGNQLTVLLLEDFSITSQQLALLLLFFQTTKSSHLTFSSQKFRNLLSFDLTGSAHCHQMLREAWVLYMSLVGSMHQGVILLFECTVLSPPFRAGGPICGHNERDSTICFQ